MTIREIVLDALRTLNKPAHINEISQTCGLSYAQISHACSQLVRMDTPLLKRIEKGVYQLTEQDTPQLPVKQRTLRLPTPLPDDFPDTSKTVEDAQAFFADKLKVWQLHKNISEASNTLAPYNLPLPHILDPQEAMIFVDAIQQYIYGTIEYNELLNQINTAGNTPSNEG